MPRAKDTPVSMTKKVKQAIFDYYYNVIYHMSEDHQYALGDFLHDEFSEQELAATANQNLENEIHNAIMDKLEEIKGIL